MHAQVADRLVVHGAKVGQADRVGEILELLPSHGPQRYRVRWSDGHESIYAPGADAEVDSGARAEAEWEGDVAARRALSAARRRGVTAGVGREASLAQESLDHRLTGGEAGTAAE